MGVLGMGDFMPLPFWFFICFFAPSYMVQGHPLVSIFSLVSHPWRFAWILSLYFYLNVLLICINEYYYFPWIWLIFCILEVVMCVCFCVVWITCFTTLWSVGVFLFCSGIVIIMLNNYATSLYTTVCFVTRFTSGDVGYRLLIECVRYPAKCSANSSE